MLLSLPERYALAFKLTAAIGIDGGCGLGLQNYLRPTPVGKE